MLLQNSPKWLWLIPVLLLTTVLGSILLNYDALWFDEWITYFITGTGAVDISSTEGTICEGVPGEGYNILDMLCVAAMDNSWPPLFFALLMGWEIVSGSTVYIDRILALFIGLLAVSATYRMGKSLFEHKTGLIAALLLGTTVFFTFYLHEIRGYTLYVLMPALNGWLYWHLLNHPESKRETGWAFALSIAGTLYTHYIGIAVVLGIGLYHIFFERPNPRSKNNRITPYHWRRILKLYINACISYGLWVAVLYISFVNESLNSRSVSTLDLLQAMIDGFSNNLWFIAVPALGLSLVRWKERPIRFLWVWALTILAVSIIGNMAADFLFHPRHIMGLMPAFVMLIAAGIVYLMRYSKNAAYLLLAIWVAAGSFYSLTPDFVNAIPKHIEAVPLTAMNTIVETAEQCATENDTFILTINTPDDEWVQDHILNYYLSDFRPMRYITISRILNDEFVQKQSSPLLPADVEAMDMTGRYSYFTENAENIYLFVLPNRPIENEVAQLDSLLQADGFVACQLVNRSDLVGTVYMQNDLSSCICKGN
jgi:hypothetical protein